MSLSYAWEGDQELFKALEYVESRINKKLSWNLNGLAYAATNEVKQKIPSWLDLGRGANFIKQSFVYDKSTPDNLSVTLGALDRAFLMPLLEQGGQRLPKNRAIGLPAGEKKIARSIKQAYAKPNTFSATIGGVDALWMRTKKKKLVPLYYWEDKTQYKPQQIHFYETVTDYFENNIDKMIKKSVDELLERFASK